MFIHPETSLGWHRVLTFAPSSVYSFHIALPLGLISKQFSDSCVILNKAWLPDENFLSNTIRMDSIKTNAIQAANDFSKAKQNSELSLIASFMNMIRLFETTDGIKKDEALRTLQGMWERFSQFS